MSDEPSGASVCLMRLEQPKTTRSPFAALNVRPWLTMLRRSANCCTLLRCSSVSLPMSKRGQLAVHGADDIGLHEDALDARDGRRLHEQSRFIGGRAVGNDLKGLAETVVAKRALFVDDAVVLLVVCLSPHTRRAA